MTENIATTIDESFLDTFDELLVRTNTMSENDGRCQDFNQYHDATTIDTRFYQRADPRVIRVAKSTTTTVPVVAIDSSTITTTTTAAVTATATAATKNIALSPIMENVTTGGFATTAKMASTLATTAQTEVSSADKQQPSPSLTFEWFSRDRTRTFHKFVLLLTTYDRLTRDEKRGVRENVLESLSATERILCAGTFRKSPARDIVRLLCYGAKTNVDRMRDIAKLRMHCMGFDSVVGKDLTDAAMMKHVDLWYEFATSSCEFDDDNVLAENIADAFDASTGTRFDGRGCRMCVNAILRLARVGLCGELVQRGEGSVTSSVEATKTRATTSTAAVGSKTLEFSVVEKPTPARTTKTSKSSSSSSSIVTTEEGSSSSSRRRHEKKSSTSSHAAVVAAATPATTTTTAIVENGGSNDSDGASIVEKAVSRKRKATTTNGRDRKNGSSGSGRSSKKRASERRQQQHQQQQSNLSMPRLSNDTSFLEQQQQHRSMVANVAAANIMENSATLPPVFSQLQKVLPVARKRIDRNDAGPIYSDDEEDDDFSDYSETSDAKNL